MERMFIGADYYPEHWPRERWETDAKLMQQANFTVTRMAEFAWARLEPEEGRYELDWLEEAVDLLGAHGVRSILCTPTPTMPKWLYDGYPEATAMDENGHRHHFGNRQNNCFSSAAYRDFSQKITRALAGRFGKNPHLAGWQLDNELSGPECFCPGCEAAFREWLRGKYGTVQALNEAWGTIFWSQCYASFDEVHLPRHPHSSPSLALDHQRFHSDLVIAFAKEQADILREECPGHFITHNTMGFAPQVDYFKLGEMLDFVADDYYYNYGETGWEDRFAAAVQGAMRLDFTRGIKQKNYWIMENSAGALGWETYGRNLRPGELRLMTLQNLARGGDGQLWFRWRTSRFGTEQYWHGLLGHDGQAGRRYSEAAAVAAELQALWPEIKGSTVAAPVAIVTDYDDRWALAQQPNSPHFSYTGALSPYYRALHRRGVNADFVRSCDALEGYRAVLLPSKYILTEAYAQKLEDYVRGGGTLLATCRTGVKNPENLPWEMTLPGWLRQTLGIQVEEYESIPQKHPYAVVYQGKPYAGTVLADWIIPEGAETLASFDEERVGFAAVTVNACGGGRAFYVGTVPDEALADALTDRLLGEAGVAARTLAENTEASVRTRDGTDYLFLLNHSPVEQHFEAEGLDLLTGKITEGSLSLPPLGAAVVKCPHREG